MGILAQFGRGMIQDVSDQMFGKFVAAARAELEKPAQSAPASERAGATGRCAAGRGAVARIRGRGPGRGSHGAEARRLGWSYRHSAGADLVVGAVVAGLQAWLQSPATVRQP